MDASANVTSLVSNVDPIISPGIQKLALHPFNKSLYVFIEGNNPELKIR